MNTQYLSGTLCTSTEEKLCHLTVLLDSDNLIEKIHIFPLNHISPFDHLSDSLSRNVVAELIINRLVNNSSSIPHKIIFKTEFQKKIFESLYSITFGTTISYKKLGNICGKEHAQRAVGNALRNNPLPIIYPCHRVIAMNGLGGFHGNSKDFIEIKKKLIELETQKTTFRIIDR